MQRSNLKLKKPAHPPSKVVFSAQAILDSVLAGQLMRSFSAIIDVNHYLYISLFTL
jgi:hypothetical protein